MAQAQAITDVCVPSLIKSTASWDEVLSNAESDKNYRNSSVQRFRGGLIFKSHRRVYDSTLGLRLTMKESVSGKKRRTALPIRKLRLTMKESASGKTQMRLL